MGAKEHKANIRRMKELIAQLKEADIAYYCCCSFFLT